MDRWIYGVSAHEQMILLRSDVPGFRFRSGPLKSSRLQPLINKQETVFLPDQPFDLPVTGTTEEFERHFIWISCYRPLHRELLWLRYFNKAAFYKQDLFHFAEPVIIRVS